MRRRASLKKLVALLLVALMVAIVLRLGAHWFLLRKTNEYLERFSPVYSGHINDFRISLWRGAYGFERLELTLREKPIRFLVVEDVDVSFAWRELFQHGRIRTDIVLTRPVLRYFSLQRILRRSSSECRRRDFTCLIWTPKQDYFNSLQAGESTSMTSAVCTLT